MIPIARVLFSHKEEQAVLKVLRSGQLAQGETVAAFEEQFASYIGSKYAVAVASGTVALHIALLALGIGPGDEVITTPYSFIASTNAILYVGATPVFVDIGEDFNIDTHKIEAKITRRTKAILPVHLFGYPCDMKAISHIAERHNLKIVEDACQAHGATYDGTKVGSFGDAGCFSFYATKNMTTGEGGMIVTDNKKMSEYAKMARSHGSRVRYHHEFLGYNARMTELSAALGMVQLQKLDQCNEKRMSHAAIYNKQLAGIPSLITPKVTERASQVYHQYTVRILRRGNMTRTRLMNVLRREKIGFGIYYPIPIHKQRSISDRGYTADAPVAERMSHEALSLPMYPELADTDVRMIADVIQRFFA